MRLPQSKNTLFLLALIYITLYVLESCSLICKCTDEDIYNRLYNINTNDGKYNNVFFPSKEELNIVRKDNQIIVDDTCITYYLDYMIYDHFTAIYECRFGSLDLVSSLSLTWPESYTNKK